MNLVRVLSAIAAALGLDAAAQDRRLQLLELRHERLAAEVRALRRRLASWLR